MSAGKRLFTDGNGAVMMFERGPGICCRCRHWFAILTAGGVCVPCRYQEEKDSMKNSLKKSVLLHIGVKLINATPMTRQEYNDFRGWTLPADKNGDDKGFLVEYLDGGKANTEEFAGYVSWSPEEVFNNAYRPTTGMNFGLAVEALKLGKKAARKGWNGKGQWVSLSGSAEGRAIPSENFWSKNNSDYAAKQPDGIAHVMPCFTLKNAKDQIQMGWLPSMGDLLSDDWEIVE
jgi:hypothetical protein